MLDVALDDLYHKVGLVYIVLYLVADDHALVVFIKNFLLHHTLTHGRHLWTMLGVDDGSHHITAEGGEHLQEYVFVVFSCLFIGIISNSEGSAVGCEATAQCR